MQLWSGIDAKDLSDEPKGAKEVSANFSGDFVNQNETLENAANTANDWVHRLVQKIIEKPKNAILTVVLDVATGAIDFIQGLANFFQTGWQHWDVVYDKDQIVGELDNYVDLRNSQAYEGQKTINVDNEETKYFYKNKNVEIPKIPVITVDLYTIAANKVDLTKANFLVKTGNENKAWTTLRDVVASIIHGLMYITIAVLITGIIIYGIQIVSRTFQTPQEKRKKLKGIEKMAIGLIMLVGTIFIEAICLYASDMILGETQTQDTYEGPLRINVTGLGQGGKQKYSFSTTPTGYFRYMAGITNIDMYQTKALYVGAYAILAIANFLCAIGMTLRMIVMMALAIMHFWLVLKFVLQSSTANLVVYRKWIVAFALLSLLQVGIAIIARFLLEGIMVE